MRVRRQLEYYNCSSYFSIDPPIAGGARGLGRALGAGPTLGGPIPRIVDINSSNLFKLFLNQYKTFEVAKLVLVSQNIRESIIEFATLEV